MNSRLRLSTRYGINTVVAVALVILIIGIVEAFSYRHNWRKDFTANRRHSLSEQSLNILRDLKEKVKITTFIQKGDPSYEGLKQLLDIYTRESKMLDIRIVDPDLNPNLANQYDIRRHRPPVAFLEGEKGRETITTLDEEQVTNALIKVTRGKKKIVCFLIGHGEKALDDNEENGLGIVKKLLEDKNYEPRPLMLMRAEKMPGDCATLVVAGPQKDLLTSELDSIQQYVKVGGRVFFLVDPETAPALKPFLENYGIVLGNNVVIDRLSRLFAGDYFTPLLTAYSEHPITKNMQVAAFFPLARSVSTREAQGANATWLAKSGEGSWAETDLAGLRQNKAAFDAGKDLPGPVTLAAVSEIESVEKKAEESGEPAAGALVVFGDSDFITNGRVNLQANADLFMNAIYWLGREETLIAIPPKQAKFSPIILTPADAKMLFFLPVVVLPGIVLFAGIYVFLKRSRHP